MNQKKYIPLIALLMLPVLFFCMETSSEEHAAYRESLEAKIAAENSHRIICDSLSWASEAFFYSKIDMRAFERAYKGQDNEDIRSQRASLQNSLNQVESRLHDIEQQRALALVLLQNAAREEKAKKDVILARVRSQLYPERFSAPQAGSVSQTSAFRLV